MSKFDFLLQCCNKIVTIQGLQDLSKIICQKLFDLIYLVLKSAFLAYAPCVQANKNWNWFQEKYEQSVLTIIKV